MVMRIGGGTYLREKTGDGNSARENMAGLGTGMGQETAKTRILSDDEKRLQKRGN